MSLNVLKFFLLFVSIVLFPSHATATVLLTKHITVGSETFLIGIHSELSRPKSNGKGYCGGGEEIYIDVYKKRSRQPIISEIIESCLKSLVLISDVEAFGGQTPRTILKALHFTESSISYSLNDFGEDRSFTANIDFSSGAPIYSEKTASPIR